MSQVKVQVYGLSRWVWGDCPEGAEEQHTLVGGVQTVEADDAYLQALRDASDAKVGVVVLEIDGDVVNEMVDASTFVPEPEDVPEEELPEDSAEPEGPEE